jgi:hypothetical protein
LGIRGNLDHARLDSIKQAEVGYDPVEGLALDAAGTLEEIRGGRQVDAAADASNALDAVKAFNPDTGTLLLVLADRSLSAA